MNKIAAIKKILEAFQDKGGYVLGLKEVKDLVESLVWDLQLSDEEKRNEISLLHEHITREINGLASNPTTSAAERIAQLCRNRDRIYAEKSNGR